MNIGVTCSELTGRIYAVKIDSRGKITGKFDVTKQVIDSVMMHMDITKEEYTCMAGDLVFKPKATEPTALPSE